MSSINMSNNFASKNLYPIKREKEGVGGHPLLKDKKDEKIKYNKMLVIYIYNFFYKRKKINFFNKIIYNMIIIKENYFF